MLKFITFLADVPEIAKQNPNEYGQYNGYVGIHKSIELPISVQGEGYFKLENNSTEEYLDDLIQVHGGITYDAPNEHRNISIYPISDIPQNWKEDYRIIGFDTLHYGDTAEKWNFDTVKSETIELLNQITKLSIKLNNEN